jgi:hypothetical protein
MFVPCSHQTNPPSTAEGEMAATDKRSAKDVAVVFSGRMLREENHDQAFPLVSWLTNKPLKSLAFAEGIQGNPRESKRIQILREPRFDMQNKSL